MMQRYHKIEVHHDATASQNKANVTDYGRTRSELLRTDENNEKLSDDPSTNPPAECLKILFFFNVR